MTRLSEAILFAARCHDGMLRKGTETPYIVHPMEATAIAAALTQDEDILCACMLHDVAEDCGVTEEELAARFGARTAQLVMSETQLCDGDPRLTWERRKRSALERIQNGDRAVKLIALADKLSNLRAIRRDFERDAEAMFSRFHQHDKRKHAWYYLSVVELLRDEFSQTREWQEMRMHAQYVFCGEAQEEGETACVV
ncbi:MAG: bifunctional (p)ppGpp synthetase/guanosine-3',5'-bis(diphosphate) 3'-pyrophosphohydrolase [Clostridia bacterium]|nr:bifunctional (p)ppGpp synthetase/guanosine-3',5'-bis(diphosphate) 3'-pyrophosphohydrolase [Clostridia bacterium]